MTTWRKPGSFISCALGALLTLPLVACGSDADATPDPAEGGSTANGGSGGSGEPKAGSGGSPSAGGTSNGSAGKDGGKAGSNLGGSIAAGGTPSGEWVDVSPPDAKKNCSGVVINRLTGDVTTDVTNQGIWRSTNQGGDWTRVDGNVVGGLVVLGPGFDVDQNEPTRMAAWSLDGDGGWTADGKTWKKITSINRNWDFGSTDWATPDPKTMIVTRHEAEGEVFLSTDGAVTWDLMSIKVVASGGGFPPHAFSMVGVMDATTLVYGDGEGILRSTDTGKTFTKVSDLNARTRVPVLFKDVFYLGGDSLIVSKDKGATWEPQGGNIEIWVGPYFGEDEKHMMITNKQGVYLTSDAGLTWTKAASLPTDSMYDPQIWGGYAWDPVNNLLYAAAVEKPLLKLILK
jgi:hypothetical protein